MGENLDASLSKSENPTLSAGDQIVVRAIGTGLGDNAPFKDGGTYLVFLHPTGLPEADRNEYYVTGSKAGIYVLDGAARGADGPSFTKDGVEDQGDNLPEQIALSELQG